jgi:hypothetical protein
MLRHESAGECGKRSRRARSSESDGALEPPSLPRHESDEAEAEASKGSSKSSSAEAEAEEVGGADNDDGRALLLRAHDEALVCAAASATWQGPFHTYFD